MAQPLPAMPMKLGKYRVSGLIGEGAMGVVYRAFDPDIHREVAIKTLRPGVRVDGADGSSAQDRFRNEARAAGRLQHPGIVSVFEFGHESSAAVDYIAMEYVLGHPLSRYLVRSAAPAAPLLSEDDVLSLVHQLLEALGHAHAQGVWHRDIKPSNLLVTRHGRLKITDFGVARLSGTGMTRVGALVGTPMYMAPEQFQGRAIDQRVDLYAAGVVLYQLLCGQAPFSGTPESLMYRVVHELPLPPSQQPGCAHLASWDSVLMRALAKSPAQRFLNAQEFRDALVQAAGRLPPETVALDNLLQAPAMGAAPTLAPVSVVATRAGTATSGPSTATDTTLSASAFDPQVLARAEAILARHVGPMARVLLRRTAREAKTLPTLMVRLAAQVDDPAARDQVARELASLLTSTGVRLRVPAGTASQGPATAANSTWTHGTATRGSLPTATEAGLRTASGTASPGSGPTFGTGNSLSSLQTLTRFSPTLLAAAQRILALHLGPIATVIVRRAAMQSAHRVDLLQRLVASIDDPAAQDKVREELRRLPD
ncbi:MAG: hypothetical protein RLY78_573 [Pseudomonadota bacterium]